MNAKKLNTLKISGLVILASLALSACATAAPTVAEASAVIPEQTEAAVVAEVSMEIESEPASAEAETAETLVPGVINPALHASGLTEAEVDSLLYMREEEKLAHDVYVTLYSIWGTPVFQNIANSEQSHTDAVKNLLDLYGLEDPAVNTPIGVFVNADLQTLYDDLIAWGSQSVADALKVGAAIEEIDILDLQESLEMVTAADVQQVYNNLLAGSENHLRAFTQTLSRQTGETYVPQYMDQAAYDAIVAGSIQTGAGLAQGSGRGANRKP
jgi:hypothetical protein